MGTLMGTLWAQAHKLSARVLNLNKEMARPERFELPTPRFVVWGPSLKSLRFVTERNRLLNGRPIFGTIAKAVVTEKNLNEGEREGFEKWEAFSSILPIGGY